MVKVLAGRPPRARRWRALAAAGWAVLAGCESLVGIHDSQEPKSSGALETRDGASMSPPGSDAATRSGDEATGVPSSTGSVSNNGDGPLGQLSPGGPSGSPQGTMGPDPSGAAASTGDGVAPGPALADAGAPVSGPADDTDPGTTTDTPPPPDDVTCSPPPPGPELAGTVFLFTAGPNGGRPDGMGSCAFPNSELPQAPRFYGAVDPELMATAALCGACMKLSNGVGSVEVTVIDVIQPLALAHGHTLSIDAAAKRVLSTSNENLDVLFSFVPCSGEDNIRLKFAAPGDASVLVLGHRNELASVRLSTLTTSVDLKRQAYNYWKPPAGFALNGSRVSLTLTDVAGSPLTVPDLQVEGQFVETGQQFPFPGCLDGAP